MNVRIVCELNHDLIVELYMFILSHISEVFAIWKGNSVNSGNMINH